MALGLGDPTKPINIGTNGGFGWGTAAAACVRPLICSNGAAILALNITTNQFNSPVTLVSGNVNLSGNFYNGMIFSNVISGAGGNTYSSEFGHCLPHQTPHSGNTTVLRSTNTQRVAAIMVPSKLVGNGSIEHSANISLQGITASQAFPGALDVSGRTDGTLTLLNGQTLRGDNGSYVKGNVVATSGTMITPGGTTNIQFMSISNNLTLQAGSTMAMDVSLDGGLTNDLVKVTGLMTYGGTLQLTNIGVTALTNGAAFKLFSNGTFSGNFATISGSPGTRFRLVIQSYKRHCHSGGDGGHKSDEHHGLGFRQPVDIVMASRPLGMDFARQTNTLGAAFQPIGLMFPAATLRRKAS